MVVGKFGGTKQDRKSLPVRAQRDRGVSVKVGIVCPAATSSITPIGLGIAPGGDDRAALLSISQQIVFRCRSRSVCCGFISQPITRLAVSAEIVSKGRPQEVYNSNRIARANKLGEALPHARSRTCDAASSACKTWCRLAECRARISEILSRLGVCGHTLSTGESGRVSRRVYTGPSARLDTATVRLPRGGGKYRLYYFSVAHGARRV